MSERYALNPHGRVARYGGACYAYDTRLTDSPLVEIATAEIIAQEFGAADLLAGRGFMLEPRTLGEIGAYVRENGYDGGVVDRLIALALLQPYESRREAIERRVVDYFNRRYLPAEDLQLEVPEQQPQDVFAPDTFFNLPRTVAVGACQVGLLGVPIASLRASLGTVTGPAHLRLSTRALCWFNVHEDGVYSEISLADGRPEVLCQGVVVRDCGDVDAQELTLAELFERLGGILATEFLGPGVRAIVVGGDHAITYPLVRAHLERFPDLGLLTLDAHNDLFYTPRVVYSHAAAISNLIRSTPIERIASFGLRTFTDKRMAAVRGIYEDDRAQARIRLHSLTETRRLIMDPRRLDEALDALAGRPYYLSLDLDVLSEAAIGWRVSTPFGMGLEWHELLTFLDAAFHRLDIVGCDVVEYNGLNGDGAPGHSLTALLLLLIDRLAKGSPKPSPDGRVARRRAGVVVGSA